MQLGHLKPTLLQLFLKLLRVMLSRTDPFFIDNIRIHSNLLGQLSLGNYYADALINLVSSFNKLRLSHTFFHQNSKPLQGEFSINRTRAREIMMSCPICQLIPQHIPQQSCNPKGLRTNQLWQMNINHIASFNKLKYTHTSIDTFSLSFR